MNLILVIFNYITTVNIENAYSLYFLTQPHKTPRTTNSLTGFTCINMVITSDIDLFIHNVTMNILKSLSNVQLWQFSVSKGNRENYEKEKNEIKNSKPAYWSKPSGYEKYTNVRNILLITSEEYVEIYHCKDTRYHGRTWWDNSHSKYGVIEIELLGKAMFNKKQMAKFCNYTKFSSFNKFQPVKKVTYNEFINNIELFIRD